MTVADCAILAATVWLLFVGGYLPRWPRRP
jgi:hypothetical protein